MEKVFVLKNLSYTVQEQWLKTQRNTVQCNVRSGKVIYGKEGFSFTFSRA